MKSRTIRIPLDLYPRYPEPGTTPRQRIEQAIALGLMAVTPADVLTESKRRGTSPEAVNIAGALVGRADALGMGSVPATIRAALRVGLGAWS